MRRRHDARRADPESRATTRLMVRTWRPERDRRIVIVVDTSRTAAARIGDEPRLDTAFEAALLLAALASHAGDRVDFVAWDRRLRGRVHGASGAELMGRMVDAMADIDAEPRFLDLPDNAVFRLLVHRRWRGMTLDHWVDLNLAGARAEDTALGFWGGAARARGIQNLRAIGAAVFGAGILCALAAAAIPFPIDWIHRARVGLGVAALTASDGLRSLTVLDLTNNDLGAAGAATLAATDGLGSLASLNLAHNELGDRGAAALAASDHLHSLARLDLTSNSVGDEGAAALAVSDGLRNLTELDLADNEVGDEGARALAALEQRGCRVQM